MEYMLTLPYEIWRNIRGYEGLYQVSNLGRVRNILTQKVLKPMTNGRYPMVCIYNDESKSTTIHRLVAMTFPDLVDWTEEAKGKPFDELQVNHKDENKSNNWAVNLEWCNCQYNNEYTFGKPVLQYTLDGKFVAEYTSTMDAERKTGCKHSNISKVCRGVNKYHNGFIWKYKERDLNS